MSKKIEQFWHDIMNVCDLYGYELEQPEDGLLILDYSNEEADGDIVAIVKNYKLNIVE